MPESFKEAHIIIDQIMSFGLAADCWVNYSDKELNTIWVQFQKLEKTIIDSVHNGKFGSYAHLVQNLYYQVKSDFRNVMKMSGNL